MDNNNQTNQPQPLNNEEERELREGQMLYEMDKSSSGWQVVKKWLEDMAFHSWVDPRDCDSKEQWDWRELNAFHASNNAREILENISKAVSRSEYLEKVKNGEIDRRKMRI